MQVSSFLENLYGQIFRVQGFTGAAVGDHGSLPRSVYHYEDFSSFYTRIANDVRYDSDTLQLFDQVFSENVVTDTSYEVRLDAEADEPVGSVAPESPAAVCMGVKVSVPKGTPSTFSSRS